MANYNNQRNISLEEVAEQLETRDRQDMEIDTINRQEMEKLGLKVLKPARSIKIDTSEIVGIDNVVQHLLSVIKPYEQIIAIQGFSGVGKSSTTKALREEINALSISFGEIFRYLTFMHYVHNETDYTKNIKCLGFAIEDDHLYLYRGKENISHGLAHHLSDPELAKLVPTVSSVCQDVVIKFLQKEIAAIRQQTNLRILLEGRAFTLDFLPCDLRIELYAHPLIRAKRRLSEISGLKDH